MITTTRRGQSTNPTRNADVTRAAHAAGLTATAAAKCGAAADQHDWRAVRKVLIATNATGHERALREAYYGE